MWRPRPPTARRSCSRSMGRTSRPRSSRTGTSTRWRVPTSSPADASCSSGSHPCPWRRTRSRWCPRATAGTRSGAPRRCRSMCGAICPSCWRSTRSGCGSWPPTSAAGSGRSSSSIRSSPSWRRRRKRWAARCGGPRRGRRACSTSTTAARRCSGWRSAPRATATSSACGWRSSATWARTRSARSCPPRPRRCCPGSTRSRGSRRADGAWSRTRRRCRRTAGRAARRRRRSSSARWT